MADYVFSELTPAQAMGVTATDIITVTHGTASQTTVIFNSFTYIVTIDGQTVTFGNSFMDLADGGLDQLVFPDRSSLYIGSVVSDSVNLTFHPTPDYHPDVVRHGAAYLGDGADSAIATEGDWLIQGNQGDDVIRVSNGQDTLYGGQGNDSISTGDAIHHEFVQGNKGDDSISGGGVADTLLGGQGNDTIYGIGGADYINGNLGNDSLIGDGVVLGEDGSDTIEGGYNLSTTLRGGPGDDVLISAPSTALGAVTSIFGDDGNDTLIAYSGKHDDLHGGAGNDVLKVAADRGFSETLSGDDGDDYISGGSGGDLLVGGAGSDTLVAGSTDDLVGGDGADRFILTLLSQPHGGGGIPGVEDWRPEDRIELIGHIGLGYFTVPATNLDSAVEMAGAIARQIPNDPSSFDVAVVAAQIGDDVYLLIDRLGSVAGIAGILAHTSLSTLSAGAFI